MDNNSNTFQANEIKAVQLKWNCSSEIFKFKSTSEIEPLNQVIGQTRAIEAIKLGSELYAKGYNIFVTGLSGTGRMSAVKQILESVSSSCPMTYDFCYVNNFANPTQPNLVRLNRGLGKELVKSVHDSIEFLRTRLPKLFEEDPYKSTRRKIIEKYQKKEQDVLTEFDEKIKPFGFIRGTLENETGIITPEVFPLIKNKPLTIDQVEELVIKGKLAKEEADKIKLLWRDFHNEIFDLSRIGMKIMMEYKKELADNDKAAAQTILDAILSEIRTKFSNHAIDKYVEGMEKHILENLAFFTSNPIELASNPANIDQFNPADFFNLFKVNLLLDNSNTNCAPIVIERNPNYTNLFGTFDKLYDNRGFWRTDFSMIKSGSILQADQGYLIVSADDLFIDTMVWYSLKRVLLYGKLEIQPLESIYQLSTSHLKPEAIDVNIKVIIIGGETLYRALYFYEKGFKKIFKINAQFDYETEKTDVILQHYASFIAKICKKELLPHCSPEGVAAIVEWAVEHAGSQNRITLKFSDVADLLREAAYYDRYSKDNLIGREEVKQALSNRRLRNDLVDEKIRNSIVEGDMLISTVGERVGQINGLTVMDTGTYSFGKPARITANISAGNSGIINIEREVNMSGKIHNKAVLIISGFLNERFAQQKSMSLNAYLAFEQSYGGIDGDSASAAEIYVILSALAKVPITQTIAITGSINQKGDIQPIGGVNDKIKGFYEICKHRGFAPNQGVIIPAQNVKDLMLSDEIIESVNNGEFKIWSISRIEQGTKILMNLEFGEIDHDNNASEGSLVEKVVARLDELRKFAKDNEEEESNSSKEEEETGNEDNENPSDNDENTKVKKKLKSKKSKSKKKK